MWGPYRVDNVWVEEEEKQQVCGGVEGRKQLKCRDAKRGGGKFGSARWGELEIRKRENNENRTAFYSWDKDGVNVAVNLLFQSVNFYFSFVLN